MPEIALTQIATAPVGKPELSFSHVKSLFAKFLILTITKMIP